MLNFEYPIHQNFDFYTGSDSLESPALLRSYEEMENRINSLILSCPMILYGFKHFIPHGDNIFQNTEEFVNTVYRLEQNYDYNIISLGYHLVFIFPSYISNEKITKETIDAVADIVGYHCMNFHIMYLLSQYNRRPILHFIVSNVAYKQYKASHGLFSKSRRVRIEQTDIDILDYLSNL